MTPLPADALAARIRGEYREMPGLRLTLAQACRLWQIDATVCEGLLRLLEAEGFLARTPDDAFIAMPTTPAALNVAAPVRRRGGT